MTTTLAQQQQALLEALWRPRHEEAIAFIAARGGVLDVAAAPSQWQRGLTAYRSNGHALARRALAGAYPVAAQLLGEDNFAALARELWLRHPPRRGDIAHWGGEFALLIESLPDLREAEPFLADVARLEWCLHRAATAQDALLDIPSLQLLASQEPARIGLRLAPGSAFVASDYPVVSIVNAHLADEPTLQQAGERLRDGVHETALVWREGLKPALREALAGEAPFIAALQEGRSLADSLEAAPALDFNQWLPLAARSGLLAGAALV